MSTSSERKAPNPRVLELLVDLRKAGKKSQEALALYLGLQSSARNEVGNWERGERIPPPQHRARYIEFYWNELGLHNDPDLFNKVCEILHTEWGWQKPSSFEMERLTGAPSPSSVSLPRDEKRLYKIILLCAFVFALITIASITYFTRQSPTGIDSGSSSNCELLSYTVGNQESVHEICAWINTDHDNHRIRGRGTVRHIKGPKGTYDRSTIDINLVRNGVAEVKYTGINEKNTSALEAYTDVFYCGWFQRPIVNVFFVSITYPDAHKETYTVTSDEVTPSC